MKFSLEDYPQKKKKNVAPTRHIKHTSTVMEHSIPNQTRIKLIDAEQITSEKSCTLDLPL